MKLDAKQIFRYYFMTYGSLHLLAGLAFWAFPPLTALFLIEPAAPPAAALIGFASALAGLGFTAAAFITEPLGKRFLILVAINGNLLNFIVHFQNVFRGAAENYMIYVAGTLLGGASLFLVWLYRKIE